MISELTRRGLLAGAGSALLAGRVGASASVSAVGMGYLEGLGRPGSLDPRVAFVPPSAVDPRYDHAIYVNTAWSGAGMQKMWVLERAGTGWRLALSDPDHWKGAEPTYSWPVSTGKLWPGNNRAGLTPTGIFNIDERAQRHRRGWGSPGMYKAVYIDLHYSSGRVSGVAMHGTTSNMYRRLGQPASHGCVRMTTANADRMWGLIHHPGGATREASERWGEVPRYFASEPADSMAARQGYVRDGSVLYDAAGQELTKEGYRVLLVFFRDDL